MDHIINDINLSVPYLVQAPYCGDDYHSFPEREGWALGEDGLWSRIGAAEVAGGPNDQSSLEAFLQSWLFFGLLTEVVGSITIEDFMYQSSHGDWYVTTEKLPQYLSSWAAPITLQPSEHIKPLLKAHLALDKAYSLVSKCCASIDGFAKPTWSINLRLALSFMMLGETMCHAIRNVVLSAKITIRGFFEHMSLGWGYSDSLLRSIRSDGWCLYSLQVLLVDLRTTLCETHIASQRSGA